MPFSSTKKKICTTGYYTFSFILLHQTFKITNIHCYGQVSIVFTSYCSSKIRGNRFSTPFIHGLLQTMVEVYIQNQCIYANDEKN